MAKKKSSRKKSARRVRRTSAAPGRTVPTPGADGLGTLRDLLLGEWERRMERRLSELQSEVSGLRSALDQSQRQLRERVTRTRDELRKELSASARSTTLRQRSRLGRLEKKVEQALRSLAESKLDSATLASLLSQVARELASRSGSQRSRAATRARKPTGKRKKS